MKAGRKFLIGAALIVASVGFLIAEGVRETGVYFLTPSEVAAKTAADPTFYDVGFKMSAKVVPGHRRAGQMRLPLRGRVRQDQEGLSDDAAGTIRPLGGAAPRRLGRQRVV